jgi:hypothetical protein
MRAFLSRVARPLAAAAPAMAAQSMAPPPHKERSALFGGAPFASLKRPIFCVATDSPGGLSPGPIERETMRLVEARERSVGGDLFGAVGWHDGRTGQLNSKDLCMSVHVILRLSCALAAVTRGRVRPVHVVVTGSGGGVCGAGRFVVLVFLAGFAVVGFLAAACRARGSSRATSPRGSTLGG